MVQIIEPSWLSAPPPPSFTPPELLCIQGRVQLSELKTIRHGWHVEISLPVYAQRHLCTLWASSRRCLTLYANGGGVIPPLEKQSAIFVCVTNCIFLFFCIYSGHSRLFFWGGRGRQRFNNVFNSTAKHAERTRTFFQLIVRRFVISVNPLEGRMIPRWHFTRKQCQLCWSRQVKTPLSGAQVGFLLVCGQLFNPWTPIKAAAPGGHQADLKVSLFITRWGVRACESSCIMVFCGSGEGISDVWEK